MFNIKLTVLEVELKSTYKKLLHADDEDEFISLLKRASWLSSEINKIKNQDNTNDQL